MIVAMTQCKGFIASNVWTCAWYNLRGVGIMIIKSANSLSGNIQQAENNYVKLLKLIV